MQAALVSGTGVLQAADVAEALLSTAAARCLGNDDLSDAERSALRELLADGVGLGMEMGVQGPVGEEDGGLSVRIEVAQGLEDAVAQLLLAGTDDPAGLMQRCLRGAMAQPLFDPASQLLLLGVARQSMDECLRGAQLSAGQRRLLMAALSAVGVKQWWVNETHDGLPGATAKMSLSMEALREHLPAIAGMEPGSPSVEALSNCMERVLRGGVPPGVSKLHGELLPLPAYSLAYDALATCTGWRVFELLSDANLSTRLFDAADELHAAISLDYAFTAGTEGGRVVDAVGSGITTTIEFDGAFFDLLAHLWLEDHASGESAKIDDGDKRGNLSACLVKEMAAPFVFGSVSNRTVRALVGHILDDINYSCGGPAPDTPTALSDSLSASNADIHVDSAPRDAGRGSRVMLTVPFVAISAAADALYRDGTEVDGLVDDGGSGSEPAWSIEGLALCLMDGLQGKHWSFVSPLHNQLANTLLPRCAALQPSALLQRRIHDTLEFGSTPHWDELLAYDGGSTHLTTWSHVPWLLLKKLAEDVEPTNAGRAAAVEACMRGWVTTQQQSSPPSLSIAAGILLGSGLVVCGETSTTPADFTYQYSIPVARNKSTPSDDTAASISAAKPPAEEFSALARLLALDANKPAVGSITMKVAPSSSSGFNISLLIPAAALRGLMPESEGETNGESIDRCVRESIAKFFSTTTMTPSLPRGVKLQPAVSSEPESWLYWVVGLGVAAVSAGIILTAVVHRIAKRRRQGTAAGMLLGTVNDNYCRVPPPQKVGMQGHRESDSPSNRGGYIVCNFGRTPLPLAGSLGDALLVAVCVLSQWRTALSLIFQALMEQRLSARLSTSGASERQSVRSGNNGGRGSPMRAVASSPQRSVPVSCGLGGLPRRRSAAAGGITDAAASPLPAPPHLSLTAIAATEDQLLGASRQQLKDALLCKEVQELGPSFDIDFATELRPFLRGRLGEGAYGMVFRGTWRDMPVAVKVMHRDAFQGGVEASRRLKSFAKEVKIMSAFSWSPHILRLHGACLRRPHVAIVYELMSGNLDDRIYDRMRAPLTLLEALRIAAGVAAGLAALHPHTVHRDLKPPNILLDADGVAKIGDFGISQHVVNPVTSTLSHGGGVGGTPLYMPPEAFDGEMGTPGDIWALGVVLNECLTQSRPYSGEVDLTFQLVYKVAVKQEHPALADAAPSALRQLLLDCWRPEPSQRPDITDVRARLDSLIRAEQYRLGGGDLAALAPPGACTVLRSIHAVRRSASAIFGAPGRLGPRLPLGRGAISPPGVDDWSAGREELPEGSADHSALRAYRSHSAAMPGAGDCS